MNKNKILKTTIIILFFIILFGINCKCFAVEPLNLPFLLDTSNSQNMDDNKVNELMKNNNIVRNRLKIIASINNSKIFLDIQKEYGSFANYLNSFTNGKIYYETQNITNSISDLISDDLRKRGMKFVGSVIIYAFLQAIGIVVSHEENCFLYHNNCIDY